MDMPEPTWPETDEERDAYEDWKYLVRNGDTLRGYRDFMRYEWEGTLEYQSRDDYLTEIL